MQVERLNTADRVVGLKQSSKKVSQGLAKAAFVASDADPRITEPFIKLCAENGVPVNMADSMKELAKACRVDVPAACAVLLKQGE